MSYKLTYHSYRARAEPIRMIFHYGQITFEDEIIPHEDWPSYKTNKKIAPFGQLPSLTLPNGTIIAETGAIVRLVAKLANIYPTDPFEAAKADMLFELVMDLQSINSLLNVYPIDSDHYQSAYQDFFQSFPRYLEYLHEEISQGGGGAAEGEQTKRKKEYFGGERPHHGDFGIFHILSTAIALKRDVLHQYPKLREYVNRMAEIPAIKEYLKRRLRSSDCGVPNSFIQVNQVEFPIIH